MTEHLSKTNHPRDAFPLVPLRDVVAFPHIPIPILVKRKRSVLALDAAAKTPERVLVCVAQKRKEVEEPQDPDLYPFGVLAEIKEFTRAPDGSVKVVIEGLKRVEVLEYLEREPALIARVRVLAEDPVGPRTPEIDAFLRDVLDSFKQVVSLGEVIPLEALITIFNTTHPGRLADFLAHHLDVSLAAKEEILETLDVRERLKKLLAHLRQKIETLSVERKVQAETQEQIGKMQKELFLREQLKTIERELGIREEKEELAETREQIKRAGMPKEVRVKAEKELSRLEKMTPMSPEYSYIRTYLDWLVTLPWSKRSKKKIDIEEAHTVLDEDHYGLSKVKERILEYLAVQKLVGKIKGPILCFVGPPGVGKTSLGRSIARAMGRKFVKVSLGGIRDEAEIRGHRRTYVGALPGRIIQAVKNASESNPVFMLDEIDKVGIDFRGDPSAALLEALDPEQNFAFSDHYLEVPFDLSRVLFITTANILDTIPPALRDRLEVIHFPGYTEDEKFHIAQNHLLPKLLSNHGLGTKQLLVTEPAIRTIIREYTREAGVRNLERELATICRKVARKLVEGEKAKKGQVEIGIGDIARYLGAPKFYLTMAEKQDEVGVATGLAWTEAGGEILTIEATKMAGKGGLMLTGQLGDVMKESAQAALSYARSRASELGIKERFDKLDLHVHVPSGAIPKDGPSAGTAIASALISLLTSCKVKRDVAMTGEITLRGRVMEIGGVKEKILAAHRAGIKMIIIPKKNKKEVEEDVPKKVREELKFLFVEHMDEVLPWVLRSRDEGRRPRAQATATPPTVA